jgi:hypothetical protein
MRTIKPSIYTLTLLVGVFSLAHAQVGIGTTSPNASARLQIDASPSTNAKGFLPPRVTASERSAIATPAAGLMVYQTDGTKGLYYYDGSAWIYVINSTDGTLPVANGGTGTTTATGTGNVVLSTGPTLNTLVVASGSDEYPNSVHILPTTHATSKRTSFRIDEWLFLQDHAANGTKNFSITERNGGSFTSRVFINVGGNVGIGNTTPNAKLDLRTNPTSTTNPGAGYLGLGTTATAAGSAGAGALRYNTSGTLEYSNGTTWIALATPSFGDVKTGIQTADHSGWVKLDGRAKSTLTASQQTQATALGIGSNLPNATDAFLVQNGTTLGSVSGSNERTLSQANLPSYNLPTATTSSSGNHAHWVDPSPVNTSTNGNHSHTGNTYGGTWTNGSGTYVGGLQAGSWTLNQSGLNINANGDHAHSVDIPGFFSGSDGWHTHTVTVASGGSGTALNIAPKSLSVNTFIYLGL